MPSVGGEDPPRAAPQPAWPDDGTAGTPYALHTDPALHAREMERIFAGPAWHFLAMEAELPEAGSFIRTLVGDTPILVTRDSAGAVQALVNRCAHRGAPLVLARSGRLQRLACPHHGWCYELDGRLRSVTQERGRHGQGGMPAGFDKAAHGLRRMRVHRLAGLVFGTFAADAPDFEDFAGPELVANTRRVCGRAPLVVLGEQRQLLHADWKLWAQTLRDTYHARTLHHFSSTMKLDQLPMHRHGLPCGADGRHHLIRASADLDADGVPTDTSAGTSAGPAAPHSTYGNGLRDAEMAQLWDDHGDGLVMTLQTMFPAFAQVQLRNTLALCSAAPLGPGRTELRWIFFGYADDDAARRRGRLKQANLMGPAGFIAMEDALVVGMTQAGLGAAPEGRTLLRMGGDGVGTLATPASSEAGLRGFWAGYRAMMGA